MRELMPTQQAAAMPLQLISKQHKTCILSNSSTEWQRIVTAKAASS